MKLGLSITILLFSLSIIVSAQTTDRTRYINYQYKGVVPETTLPNGVRHLGGGLIGDFDADPVYGISQVQKGRTKMLWLEASTGKDDTGVTGWKVLDVLSFPALLKTDYLYFINDPSIMCLKNGSDVPDLVGVGRLNSTRGVFQPSKLWVANLKTKRFEPYSVAGVKCQYSEP
jgi:hypothetical protein